MRDIPVLVVCATLPQVLYWVFVFLLTVTHPAFFTHSCVYRVNLTMSGSQTSFSEPIKIIITDEKQINVVFNPELSSIYIQCNVVFPILSSSLQPGELVMSCTSIEAPILAKKGLYSVPGELLVQMIIRQAEEKLWVFESRVQWITRRDLPSLTVVALNQRSVQMYTRGLDQTMSTIHSQDSYTQHQPGKKKTRLELFVFLHGQNTIFVLGCGN